jgi:hypothetical protein
MLPHLHEPSILHVLCLRFSMDVIYTYTGPILLAVNPFKQLPLYSQVATHTIHHRPHHHHPPASSSPSSSRYHYHHYHRLYLHHRSRPTVIAQCRHVCPHIDAGDPIYRTQL